MASNPSRKVLTADWIRTWHTSLVDLGKRLQAVEPGAFSAGTWSVNKLAYLGAYAREIFGVIGKKNFDRLYYIDLLAGNGVTQAKDSEGSEYHVAGSAIAIPALTGGFHRVFANDASKRNVEILNKRVNALRSELSLPDFAFKEKDANDVVDEIIDQIKTDGIPGSLSLTFVDNQGLDLKLDAIRKLSRLFNDIFILYPTIDAWRLIGAVRKGTHSRKNLDDFFGGPAWEGATTDIEARDIYTKQVLGCAASHAPRTTSAPPEIKGPKGYRYHIVSSVRVTPNGSKFLDGAEVIAKRVDGMTWKELRAHEDVASGKQRSLGDYSHGPKGA